MSRSGKQTIVILPVLIGIAVVAFLIVRYAGNTGSVDDAGTRATTIQQRVTILFDAAQNGDVESYLNSFTEPLRSERKTQLGTQAADKLRASVAQLKGIVNPPTKDEGTTATIVIEKVYTEHQERWRLQMTRSDGDWKIAAMTPLRKTAPKIKYGTPVVPELPPRKKLPQ